MSSRRNGSVSRAAETASKSRLHMDRNPHHARITDPSNPAGRRKEIDNVMKRARQASPGSWDRKLLEVEEKDPNRWRHTGYKQLYIDGSPSSSPKGRSRTPRRSRSPAGLARRSRSPLGVRGRSRSPIGLSRRSRSPIGLGRRSRSPIGLSRRTRSPIVMGRRSRSPIGLGRRSRSPIGRRSPVRRSRSRGRRSRSKSLRSPRRSPRRGGSPVRKSSPRRSPRGRRTPPPQPAARPRTPPPKPAARRESPSRGRPVAAAARPRAGAPRGARPPSPPDPPRIKQPVRAEARAVPSYSSPSGSSMSSCSDESCSVCSAKNKRPKTKPSRPSPPPKRPERPPPAKPTAPPAKVLTKPLNSGNANAKPSSLPLQPTRELLKAREASKRTREEKVLEWQRSQMNVARAPPPAPPAMPATRRIKREGERSGGAGAPSAARAARDVSPAAIAAALANHSDEDEDSSASSEPPPQRLTLSERFGKMAQWSADRSARLENMRITRRDAGLHVRIERPPGAGGAAADALADDDGPPEPYALDPAPVGSYPEELLAAAPGGLPSWDDVRVRYDYYKKRGYLRGLTLADYVKWEEWWYKYQEWLKRERAYEHWAAEGEARRERRRRGGRHRRS